MDLAQKVVVDLEVGEAVDLEAVEVDSEAVEVDLGQMTRDQRFGSFSLDFLEKICFIAGLWREWLSQMRRRGAFRPRMPKRPST